MNVAEKTGVQSYCFRNFKNNAKTAALVKKCGLSKIELCGAHVDFSDESAFGDVIKTYTDAGVEIVSIGVSSMADNEERERKHFEFLKMAGAKVMSVSFDINAVPQCFRTAEKLADEYGVRLAIHNHGGGDWLGNATTLAWVFDNTSDRIGLCLDTAWALDSGEDPVAMAERFADRLYGIHLKDFTFDSARRPVDVVVGEGNLDLKKLIQVMDKVGFDGYSILEYEGDVENPVSALKKCVDAIKKG